MQLEQECDAKKRCLDLLPGRLYVVFDDLVHGVRERTEDKDVEDVWLHLFDRDKFLREV